MILDNSISIRNIVSSNDGDVCNYVCTEFLLKQIQAQKLNEPIVCIDIGVDKGWWSALCLETAQNTEVYAFEPNPNTIKELENTFQSDIRFHLIPKAVSDKESTLFLTLDESCSHSRDASGVPVQTTTLDFLFDRIGMIDIIKLDTEGHEWQIFNALTQRFSQTRVLIFEFTVYWYGASRPECMDRSYSMLEQVINEFPYVYSLSRNGPPKLFRIEDEDDIHTCLQWGYSGHLQQDILATRIPFDSLEIPIVGIQDLRFNT